ncbi:MAG: hypothetical protein ACE5G1_07100, partial [bacterium]
MLKHFLLRNWDKFFGTSSPENLQIVPISSCIEDFGNSVILIFTRQNVYPEYVMKIIKNSAYSMKLNNEFFALKSLSGLTHLEKYIPQAYYLGNIAQ